MRYIFSLIILAGVMFFSACEEDESVGCTLQPNLVLTDTEAAQLANDISAIDAYLTDNNIVAIEDPSGVRYTIDMAGDGEAPNLCNMVEVTYTGSLLSDGSIFDSANKPVEFYLGHLIKGWQVVLPKIKTGATVTIYVPSVYGYGTNDNNDDIPANSNLVFEVSLIAFHR